MNHCFTSECTKISGLSVKNGKVILGFRAEDASVANRKAQINAPIYALEILGDATMVTVKIGRSLVSVKADKSYRARIEDPVAINIPAQKCHLFNQETGDRIEG